jgi:predicted nucleic-acid-binding Zn-ribbon protein
MDIKTKCPKCGSEKFIIVTNVDDLIDVAVYLDAICDNGHNTLFLLAKIKNDKTGYYSIYNKFISNKDVNLYDEYIKSDKWKQRAKLAKERAGYRCQLCNKKGTDQSLHAHHRTYTNLGNEDDMDITILCEEHHALFHNKHDGG